MKTLRINKLLVLFLLCVNTGIYAQSEAMTDNGGNTATTKQVDTSKAMAAKATREAAQEARIKAMDDAKTAHNKAVEAAKESRKKATDDANAAYDKAVEAAKDSRKKAMDDANATFKQAITDAKDKNEKALADIKANNAKSM